MRVRAATPEDHATYARLFPELGVDDPIFDAARFASDLAPTTLIVEEGTRAVGYAYFRAVSADDVHVSQIVVAPEARRRGVGRALLESVARANASAKTWRLNVKRDNAAAIALYEKLGFAIAFESVSLELAWSSIAREARGARIEPRDDARVESAMKLAPGQIAVARASGRRIPIMLEEDGAVVGVAIFDPTFPGASPFRAVKPEHAPALLCAMRAHARPNDATVNVAIENRPDVVLALLELGARVRFEMFHMIGALPR